MYLPGHGLSPWIPETLLGFSVTPQTIPELKLVPVRLMSVGVVTMPSRGHMIMWEDSWEEG